MVKRHSSIELNAAIRCRDLPDCRNIAELGDLRGNDWPPIRVKIESGGSRQTDAAPAVASHPVNFIIEPILPFKSDPTSIRGEMHVGRVRTAAKINGVVVLLNAEIIGHEPAKSLWSPGLTEQDRLPVRGPAGEKFPVIASTPHELPLVTTRRIHDPDL